MRRTYPRWFGALVLLILAVEPQGLASASAPVPPEVQARLFKKIFAYDKALANARDLKVLVLDSAGESADIVAAFSEIGITASAVRADAIESQLEGPVVIYVPNSGATAAVKQLCAKKKLLSISGIPSHAEEGHVTVAIGKKSDGRPEIIIHSARMKQEGQEFFADLLRMARVIE